MRMIEDRHGQEFMIGILVMVMALIIFIATIPAIKDITNDARGCSYLNCAGFIDSDAAAATTSCAATNQTYTSGLETDSLACTIIDLQIPYLILGVLVVAISLLMRGKLVRMLEPEPAYGGYGGGYGAGAGY